MKIGDKVRIKDKSSLVSYLDSLDNLEIVSMSADGISVCKGLINGKVGTQRLYTEELELINPLRASTIVEYYKIYQSYLLAHDLQDDTDSITVDQLVDFVENHILNG